MLTIRGIDHVVLRVRDIERMRSFEGEGPTGCNMDHLCLRVEPFDKEAIVKHLNTHGVVVGDIKERFGAEGNGVSIYLTDPEGNIVELKGPSDGEQSPPISA